MRRRKRMVKDIRDVFCYGRCGAGLKVTGWWVYVATYMSYLIGFIALNWSYIY